LLRHEHLGAVAAAPRWRRNDGPRAPPAAGVAPRRGCGEEHVPRHARAGTRFHARACIGVRRGYVTACAPEWSRFAALPASSGRLRPSPSNRRATLEAPPPAVVVVELVRRRVPGGGVGVELD